MFKNRTDAGRQLAGKVSEYLGRRAVSPQSIAVTAIPRGGVPVALEVARALKAPLDLIVCKKIGAPDNPELAVGAVSSHGTAIRDNHLFEVLKIDDAYFEVERVRLINKCVEMEKEYEKNGLTADRPSYSSDTVILIDDGIATGMTVFAAIESLTTKVNHIVVAVPVMSKSSYRSIQKMGVGVVSVMLPDTFASVSLFYQDFSQVEEPQLLKCLEEARQIATTGQNSVQITSPSGSIESRH